MRPDEKRELVETVVQNHPKLSLRQACLLIGLSTSVFRYQRVARVQDDHFLNRLAALS